MYVRRLARRYSRTVPSLAAELIRLVREAPSQASPLRADSVTSVPIDLDSRLQLVRPEFPIVLENEPILGVETSAQLRQLVNERSRASDLMQSGLHPTKSALFVGPPGVGKTLAARWLARELDVPLLVLDLAAVMSSFLGRTGANVKQVLEYAKSVQCVLLLDEFDAIAKRRDDTVEIGELKRLVTVLLQEIDDWPTSGLLIAATNHAELLDPAVWRRFEIIVRFEGPNEGQVEEAVRRFLGEEEAAKLGKWVSVAAMVFKRLSFSEIERELLQVRRESIVHGLPLKTRLQLSIKRHVNSLKRDERARLADALVKDGFSQRVTHEWTGVSRDTIRKNARIRR